MSETKVQSIIVAATAVLNMLVLLDILHLTDVQIAGITTALMAVMGVVRAWFAPEVPFGMKEESPDVAGP